MWIVLWTTNCVEYIHIFMHHSHKFLNTVKGTLNENEIHDRFYSIHIIKKRKFTKSHHKTWTRMYVNDVVYSQFVYGLTRSFWPWLENALISIFLTRHRKFTSKKYNSHFYHYVAQHRYVHTVIINSQFYSVEYI